MRKFIIALFLILTGCMSCPPRPIDCGPTIRGTLSLAQMMTKEELVTMIKTDLNGCAVEDAKIRSQFK